RENAGRRAKSEASDGYRALTCPAWLPAGRFLRNSVLERGCFRKWAQKELFRRNSTSHRGLTRRHTRRLASHLPVLWSAACHPQRNQWRGYRMTRTENWRHSFPGTSGANFPFWSFDSRAIGFFAGGKLQTITLEGGSPTVVCDAALGRGGTWNSDGTILFAPTFESSLFQVPSSGGTS